MRWIIFILSSLLLASLAANLYLYSELRLDHHALPATVNTAPSRHQGATAPVQKRPAKANQPLSEATSLTRRQNKLASYSKMLQQGRFTDLELTLREYLNQYPNDMAFLMLEAQLIVNTQPMSNAIEHYYGMLKMPLNPQQYGEITQQIETLTSNAIDKLRQAQAWDVLAMFTEPLLQLSPTNKHYILALASAYAQQQQENLMESALASLPPDDTDAAKIRRLIKTQYQEPDVTAVDDTPVVAGNSIPLSRRGDHFIVQANLSNHSINLMIDTGASTTSISQQAFDRIKRRTKRRFIGRFTVNTAGGQIVARCMSSNA